MAAGTTEKEEDSRETGDFEQNRSRFRLIIIQVNRWSRGCSDLLVTLVKTSGTTINS